MEKARDLVEAKLREQPDDADSMIQLSWINLALRRDAEAVRLARQATELVLWKKMLWPVTFASPPMLKYKHALVSRRKPSRRCSGCSPSLLVFTLPSSA
jgi:hypothetical protein